MSIVSDESQFRQLSFLESITDSESPSQESIEEEEIGQTPTNIHRGKLFLGQAGEHLVCYLFGMWQYNVLQPVHAHSVYDLVVERDGAFKKLQVKTKPIGDSKKVNLHKNLNYHKDRKEIAYYEEKDFDYLCACKFPHVYVIPFRKIKQKTCVTLSQYPEYKYDLNNPQTYEYRPI